MKLFRWDKGRQDARYSKMLLATSQRFKFDCYLLKIMDGSAIPEHTDPAVEGFEHHRVNMFLLCTQPYDRHLAVQGPSKTWLFGRIMYFRPDLYKHSMRHMNQMWTGKATYILSIGWLKKAR